jgi:hypothetical protein
VIWGAIIATTIVIAIPLVIIWGIWQLDSFDANDIDWRDED